MKSIKFILEANVKRINPIKVFSVFLVVSYLLSACVGGAAPTASAGSDKILAQSVVYMGVVESILDDQWTINGITVMVDPSTVREGPFGAVDRVKVEGIVNEDGSLTISRVEAPSPENVTTLPELGNENEDNSNDDNANESNSNDDNTNDDNGSVSNSNDDDSGNANTNASNSNDDDDNSGENEENDNDNDDSRDDD